MPDLKPCPFCGGKAERLIQRYAGDTDFDAAVYCTGCGCTIRKKFSLQTWTRNKMAEAEWGISVIWNGRVNNG